MTSIGQAARAEAERRYTWEKGYTLRAVPKKHFTDGASWLAGHLLSDESVERVARALYEREPVWSYSRDAPILWDGPEADVWVGRDYWRAQARDALIAGLGTNNTERNE